MVAPEIKFLDSMAYGPFEDGDFSENVLNLPIGRNLNFYGPFPL